MYFCFRWRWRRFGWWRFSNATT